MYLKRFEDINWEFDEEEYDNNLDYDKIQPYTIVKIGRNFAFTIGDFVSLNGELRSHIYPDKIGEVRPFLLVKINNMHKIYKKQLIDIIEKRELMNNLYENKSAKRYVYNFDEIYPLMTDGYKEYLNNNYDNILKKYNYF